MSINDFNNAFREVISLEFSHIPDHENSIDYTFSERFNRKMEKLIRAQRKSYYYLINTAAKRVAIIFIAVIAIFGASMSVKAIREPFVEFIVETYEKFTKYFFAGETTNKIEKAYVVTEMPEGFTQTQRIESDTSILTVLENPNNDCIKIIQSITDGFETNLNNENVNNYYKQVNGKLVAIDNRTNAYQLTWTIENYCFEIITYGEIDIESLLHLIEHIQ